MSVYDILEERGYIEQNNTHEENSESCSIKKKVTFYIGFGPPQQTASMSAISLSFRLWS